MWQAPLIGRAVNRSLQLYKQDTGVHAQGNRRQSVAASPLACWDRPRAGLHLSSVTWAGETLKGQEELGVLLELLSLLAPPLESCPPPARRPQQRKSRGAKRTPVHGGPGCFRWQQRTSPSGNMKPLVRVTPPPAPHWHQGKLRHSTGTHRCDYTLLVKKDMAFTSVLQSAQNNMCIFIKFP